VAIVPSFDYDLFISYAHRNDAPWKAGQNGWVTEFVLTLKAELEAQDRAFRIWFDPTLRTADHVDLAIDEAISRSAVFLSVLSPAWDDCAYCKHEVTRFREQRHPVFGMTVGTLSRLQGLVYKDVDRLLWPPEIRQQSPYRFISSAGITLNKPDEPDEAHPYVIGVAKVRDSIWSVLCAMRDAKARGVADHQYDIRPYDKDQAVTVLLADVSDDLYYKRDNLQQALHAPPRVQANFLDGAAIPFGAALSLHLFGRFPGRPVAGRDKPLSYLQLAAALDSHPVRRPLVWLARDVTGETAETAAHKTFLESLFDDSRIELLRVSFEDLKDEIAARLPVKREGPGTRRDDRFEPIVHVWHRPDDIAPVDPLKDYLKDKHCGISVFPYSESTETAVQSRLAHCDGLIVSYTEGTRSWAEDVMMKTLRLRRREERPLAFAALAMPPPSPNAFNFEHPRIVAVKATPQGRFDDVDRFLSRIEGEGV